MRTEEAELEFKGAYRKLDDYLVKNRVIAYSIAKRFTAFTYLQAPIADHFAPVPYELLLAIIEGVEPDAARISTSK